jgi:hypothetical protein
MPDLNSLADYFQKQANRAQNKDRKAKYQRYADDYRAKAKEASLEQEVKDVLRELLDQPAP